LSSIITGLDLGLGLDHVGSGFWTLNKRHVVAKMLVERSISDLLILIFARREGTWKQDPGKMTWLIAVYKGEAEAVQKTCLKRITATEFVVERRLLRVSLEITKQT